MENFAAFGACRSELDSPPRLITAFKREEEEKKKEGNLT